MVKSMNLDGFKSRLIQAHQLLLNLQFRLLLPAKDDIGIRKSNEHRTIFTAGAELTFAILMGPN